MGRSHFSSMAAGYLLAILVACNFTGSVKTKPFSDVDARSPLQDAKKQIEGSAADIGKATAAIQDDAAGIKKEVGEAEKVLPPDARIIADPHLSEISQGAERIVINTGKLDVAKAKLSESTAKIQTADSRVAEIESEYQRAVKEAVAANKRAEEADKRARDATKKILRWIAVASVVAGGIAVALMFFGHFIWGAGLGAAAVATAVFAITLERYFDYIALGGLGVLAIAIIVLVYQFFIRDKAVEEVVATTEAAKERMTTGEKRRVFGHGAEPGMAYMLQSNSTEKRVSKVRRRLKPRWDHTLSST